MTICSDIEPINKRIFYEIFVLKNSAQFCVTFWRNKKRDEMKRANQTASKDIWDKHSHDWHSNTLKHVVQCVTFICSYHTLLMRVSANAIDCKHSYNWTNQTKKTRIVRTYLGQWSLALRYCRSWGCWCLWPLAQRKRSMRLAGAGPSAATVASAPT